MKTAYRSGFARRDLILLVVSGATLLVVLLPWLAELRERARGNACADRQRALAQACIDYESAYGSFPPAVAICDPSRPWISTGFENGMICAGPNWATQILAYLDAFEADELNRAVVSVCDWELEIANFADESERLGLAQVGTFRPNGTPTFLRCPSAPEPLLPHTSTQTEYEDLAKGNYAACVGAGTYLESIHGMSPSSAEELSELERLRTRQGLSVGSTSSSGVVAPLVIRPMMTRDGYEAWIRQEGSCSPMSRGMSMCAHGRGTKIRKIRDGTSRTILLSEVLTVDGQGELPGTSEDIRGVWVTASMGGSTYSHQTTPNSVALDAINGCESQASDLPASQRVNCRQVAATGESAGNTFAAARSAHGGGVFAARADGSVGFYSNTVAPAVWRAWATAAGGDSALLAASSSSVPIPPAMAPSAP